MNTKCMNIKLLSLLRAAFCALVAGGTAAHAQSGPPQSAGHILLRGDVTLLVRPDELVPVRRAAADLASDLGKVFGTKPRFVSREQDAGPVTISIEEAKASPAAESFSIATGTAQWGGRPVQLIRLRGADMRGTIYAIYQFSQQYLGVDPMYYWTDHEPRRRASIALPASLDRQYPAPMFRYRGFFINDEDLLTGWAPGEAKDKTGISLAVWNKIYETILRLKGNMVVAGTWPFPGEPQDRLAAERGLVLSQHHAEPLGVNFARWPRGVPYNFTEHPEILERAWKNAVAAYPADQQLLWSVGLRGLSDQPYSALDPSVRGNPQAQGRLISKAIADQIRIVRAVHPDAQFVTDLWMEGAKLMQSGELTIPPEVMTVWPDTGYGDMQDNGQVRAGQGAYLHVAMMNDAANQLTEMVPIDKLFAEMARYQRAKATSFLLVNTSDLRPVTMGARAVLDFAWGGSAMGTAQQYLRDWSSQEFGARAALELAALYQQYYAAPAHNGNPHRTDGDQYYHTRARDLILSTMLQWPLYAIPDQAPQWQPPHLLNHNYHPESSSETARKEVQDCGDAQGRWDAVWKRAVADQRLVEPTRRPFYHAQVLTMIAINRESNRMLFLLSQAVGDLDRGDRAAASQKIQQAIEAMDAVKQAEAAAEYGKWKNWYHGDWLVGVDRTREMLQAFARYIHDPTAPVPPPIVWSDWEAYYHILHYEGDRAADVR